MRGITFATLVLVWAVASARSASAGLVYIALGDSITFGETDLQYAPSNGDRGYVQNYAFALGNRLGQTPAVVNLAIDGETASSFLSGTGRVPPVASRTDAILASENTNYNPNALVSQSQNFLSTVAAEKAAGNTVTTVSITLGFNDLATALTTNAGVPIATILANYQAQYDAILKEIKQAVPGANVLVLGYYNPFPADPSSPAAPLFNAYGMQLNSIISNLAGMNGDTYVNTAPAFLGHEADLTYIAQQPSGSSSPNFGPYIGTEPIGNVHPNNAGYLAIANEIEATPALVPEPSSIALLAAGCVCVVAVSRRRPLDELERLGQHVGDAAGGSHCWRI